MVVPWQEQRKTMRVRSFMCQRTTVIKTILLCLLTKLINPCCIFRIFAKPRESCSQFIPIYNLNVHLQYIVQVSKKMFSRYGHEELNHNALVNDNLYDIIGVCNFSNFVRKCLVKFKRLETICFTSYPESLVIIVYSSVILFWTLYLNWRMTSY